VAWAAHGTAVVLAASVLDSGYFNLGIWAPLALAAMVLFVVVTHLARPAAFTRHGVVAAAGLGLLLALSLASMLWAESKESAWTDGNRLAFYVVLFALGLLVIRDRSTGRRVLLILGAAALLPCLWMSASMLLGGSQGAFLERRLNAPIDYINGTAGLLVMGLWPWLAYAETASQRWVRSGALAAGAVIAGTVVLTQSRAVIPDVGLSALLALACCRGRTRRGVNLLLLAVAVGAGLHWTLAVYSAGGPAAQTLAPSHGVLRSAAAAILACGLGTGLLRWCLSALAQQIPALRRRVLGHRLGWGLATAVVLVVGIGSAVGEPWLARQYRSFTSLHVNQAAPVRFVDASGFRYDLWRVAVHEFIDHPLIGLGAGNYDAEYYRLRRNPQAVLQPHSLELQMAAELGVGGVVALFMFCGAILAASFARRRTLASSDRMIKVAATGMFAAWLVGTSVDWLYDIPGLTGMAILCAAALVVPQRSAARIRTPRRLERGVVIVTLLVVALLAASVGRQYLAARLQQSGAAQVSRSPTAAISTLREALGLDPYSLPTLYSLAAAYARQDNYGQARATLMRAAAREPANYVPPALLGDLAVRRGDYAAATADYKRAEQLDPHDPMLRQAEARVTNERP
jgi:hypothetical protein